MKWIRIDPANLPKGQVLASNFQPGTADYKENLLGRLHLLENGDIIVEEGDSKVTGITHYMSLTKFSFSSWLVDEDGGRRRQQSPIEVMAVDMEHAMFMAALFNIKHDDISYTYEEIDASDIGGSLGLALNRFDPRVN